MTYAESILNFYASLPKIHTPPCGVEVIYPFDKPQVRRVMEAFYTKYYEDDRPRILLWGINPGRYGAGVTGVCFTDPILMEEVYGIANDLPKHKELSAGFICDVISAYGGAEAFFKDFLFATVLPFGLLKGGKNYNYYDDEAVAQYFESLIVDSMVVQTSFPSASRHTASIGTGKNYAFMQELNRIHRFFDTIEPLPHPRWVEQYKKGERETYIQTYLSTLERLKKLTKG